MIWSDPYLVIRRVNILLSGIDVVPFNTTYTDALGNTRRLNESMKAEARFLRVRWRRRQVVAANEGHL